MPYSSKQCALFGAMSSGSAKGEPPSDWKKHCKHGMQRAMVKAHKKKKKQR